MSLPMITGTSHFRFSSRHIRETIKDYLFTNMGVLGWDTDPPFGTTPVAFKDEFPFEWEQIAKLQANQLAVSFDTEFPGTLEELGGPLASMRMTVFIDCYMENASLAVAILNDVRDILMGRFDGTSSIIPVLDYVQNPPEPVPGWYIDLHDIDMSWEGKSSKWHSMVCWAEVTLVDAGLGK